MTSQIAVRLPVGTPKNMLAPETDKSLAEDMADLNDGISMQRGPIGLEHAIRRTASAKNASGAHDEKLTEKQ